MRQKNARQFDFFLPFLRAEGMSARYVQNAVLNQWERAIIFADDFGAAPRPAAANAPRATPIPFSRFDEPCSAPSHPSNHLRCITYITDMSTFDQTASPLLEHSATALTA